jgi:glucose/mannose transport system substrate-binding protein
LRNDFFKCTALAATLGLLLFATFYSPIAAQDLPKGELEIYAWWSGDEGPALDALIKLFESRHPQVEVINATVTDGSGINAKTVLNTRMLGGNPPDSFQVHAGQELIGTWVRSERMEDLTALFQSQGWIEAFPSDLIQLIGTDDGIWSVPVNIHRSNLLWYVPANLKKWGVTPPTSWEAFFKIAPKLRAQGVKPLALATNWTASHLWESVALAVLGPDQWSALWKGNLDWTSEAMISVWQVFNGILEYTNDDAPSLSWQQAIDMVVNGQAAFNIMGDWAAAYMRTTLKLRPGRDFGWLASPGTGGQFMFLADSFGLPQGAPNRGAALAWLTVLGSREGSDTFNALNGSISARLDSDLSKYNAYSKTAARDFKRDRIVGSLAHGVVANEGFKNDFASVMAMFLKNRNPHKAAQAGETIAIKNGIIR